MNATSEGPKSKVYDIAANVTFEDLTDHIEFLWQDLHREGSSTYKRAVASGIEISALPVSMDEVFDFRKSAAGLDHSVVDFVVMLAGTEAAKVAGRGVIKATTQLWDHVFLPLIRSKWGDESLKEKGHAGDDKK
ncbi:hypothetical protein [Burkholderia vietnamiensis]|uniref:hypothetical protein n=1 Tax=Burkholderia vietnamiensis TaxID=60552 RepID=UPI001CF3933D|nr:hypothetical protein [Burkholderia vietnamiensis]MCA8287299.1 hypothetical protein [Burkholderia vietnamiensis]